MHASNFQNLDITMGVIVGMILIIFAYFLWRSLQYFRSWRYEQAWMKKLHLESIPFYQFKTLLRPHRSILTGNGLKYLYGTHNYPYDLLGAGTTGSVYVRLLKQQSTFVAGKFFCTFSYKMSIIK